MLSELRYGSLLSYSPKGSRASSEGRFVEVCDAIKKGRRLRLGERELPVYEYAAIRLREEIEAGRADVLRQFFPEGATLVPVPRRAPLPPEGALWPPSELCHAIVKEGLAADAAPLLERVVAVPKSAFARPGERPKPSVHFKSLRVASRLSRPNRITLIDDVVTKGATLIAAASQLAIVFPEAEIRAFALMRTRGVVACENSTALDPFAGRIFYDEAGDSAGRDDY